MKKYRIGDKVDMHLRTWVKILKVAPGSWPHVGQVHEVVLAYRGMYLLLDEDGYITKYGIRKSQVQVVLQKEYKNFIKKEMEVNK